MEFRIVPLYMYWPLPSTMGGSDAVQFALIKCPESLIMNTTHAASRIVIVDRCSRNMAVATLAESVMPRKARNAKKPSTNTQPGRSGRLGHMDWQ